MSRVSVSIRHVFHLFGGRVDHSLHAGPFGYDHAKSLPRCATGKRPRDVSVCFGARQLSDACVSVPTPTASSATVVAFLGLVASGVDASVA
eukprot:798121-Lingulodinium_polyedra.AAC.1